MRDLRRADATTLLNGAWKYPRDRSCGGLQGRSFVFDGMHVLLRGYLVGVARRVGRVARHEEVDVEVVPGVRPHVASEEDAKPLRVAQGILRDAHPRVEDSPGACWRGGHRERRAVAAAPMANADGFVRVAAPAREANVCAMAEVMLLRKPGLDAGGAMPLPLSRLE
eukprot:CAMPEP_0170590478 /NCGR_PEP_ID=MMETSP0224-20130122/11893_1 /TAXON_ID=285029 /ORGANISM="Togula jolla, Strain CCCM 725" /LENGTH=166 /DNA_ID=CAMNT_0010914281 /DNA_START=8 /DNA_END=506 /DNA_ORIENTATION=-